MSTRIHHHAIVPVSLALERLDRAAGRLFPEYSRARLQEWIKSGELTVDGELRRPKDKLAGGEELEIDASIHPISFTAEDIPLDIVYEDADLMVVNKPAGLVIHPGAGNPAGTMLNGLLHYCGALASVPRAGIVHRLDKETTGLVVVAKTIMSQNAIVQQLQARKVSRIYDAVVFGVVDRPGRIDAPIGRNPANRTRMSIQASGKEAVTHYRVVANFPEHTHLEVSLETGRTHQIRVHMGKIGHPLVGDATYGGGFKMPRNKNPELVAALRHMNRQALHARKLSLLHPRTGEPMCFTSDLPGDMADLLAVLDRVA
jgi:23S rRNA pseudouridine1911/1915/1917 synthase